MNKQVKVRIDGRSTHAYIAHEKLHEVYVKLSRDFNAHAIRSPKQF